MLKTLWLPEEDRVLVKKLLSEFEVKEMVTTYSDLLEKVTQRTKESLEREVVNTRYNNWCRDWADFSAKEEDLHGYGKRLPYIGWFWRDLNFYDRSIEIGDCGEFIGFMANNKWDYPERSLTDEEFFIVVGYIDRAVAVISEGGNVGELIEARDSVLSELWDYLQTLKID